MKTFLLYLFLFFSAFGAIAQTGAQNPRRAEKIRALYVAYISEQLQFTPAEAERFWPAHQQFETEVQAINNSNLSDLDKQQRVLDVKKRYQPVFGRIIGNERSNNFYRKHDQFRDKLLEVRQKRMDGKAGGGRPRARMGQR